MNQRTAERSAPVKAAERMPVADPWKINNTPAVTARSIQIPNRRIRSRPILAKMKTSPMTVMIAVISAVENMG